ncbi:MAG: nicotinate-nucleotide--dimethylbenzimidazole phosphoribosyltransferase [Blautia sp.]|nr:nicotinate-nucleotide--dimethylbenzimidazole phosphoribosyltransferase [Blautia sp.]MDY5032020.1 nicotinate-nucleotide--dimethylbenzimidazole phosphoribosyltransferase [Blautia sp.]
MKLEEIAAKIRPLDQKAMEAARVHWNSIAKPLHSLGKLEEMVIQIAGIQGTADVHIPKRALVAMCADNGVVEEGVTQTGQEVTAIVAENFLKGETSVCVMCRQCGVQVFPVDVGMAVDTKVRTDLKVAYGTRNIAKEAAMTREQAVKAVEAGIAMAVELKEQGYQILATGEMGIGNTTTSSAMASVLLDRPVEEMTGRGSGLTSDGLQRKINVIKKAIRDRKPDREDVLDVLAKVGGFDIAGMAGVFLGGAACGMPVIMDGFISCVAALVAKGICPTVADYILASHVSKEPAAHYILEALEKPAVLHADMCLGEGTGAIALLPILDLGLAVYHSMSTFEDIQVDQYEELI